MATTKAAGSTKLGRDSRSKRLGVKKFAGERVLAGNIIVRQKGTHYFAGKNTKIGSDYTIYAAVDGTVEFKKKMKPRFTGKLKNVTMVTVAEAANTAS